MDIEHSIPVSASGMHCSSVNTWWPLLFWEFLELLVDKFKDPVKSLFFYYCPVFTWIFTERFWSLHTKYIC